MMVFVLVYLLKPPRQGALKKDTPICEEFVRVVT